MPAEISRDAYDAAVLKLGKRADALETRTVVLEDCLGRLYAALINTAECTCYLGLDDGCALCDPLIEAREQAKTVLGEMTSTRNDEVLERYNCDQHAHWCRDAEVLCAVDQALQQSYDQGVEALRARLVKTMSAHWDTGTVAVIQGTSAPTRTEQE